MAEEVTKTTAEEVAVKKKKGLSKGAKAVIIIASILVFLIIVALVGGVIYLHYYCETKEYDIVSLSEYTDEDINLVAHRGFSAVAPENTAPAYEEAGKAGFDGAECDIYMTSDGVWVIQHDPNTYRMMDINSFIENITYDELLTYTYDNGSNIENYPDLKICTLEEYLEVCKEYGMTPVVELKGTNNTEHYDKVVETIEETGMEDEVVFISFHIENLQLMRELTDATLYYLVYTISDEDIEDALALGGSVGLDFDASKDGNTPEVIDGARNAGLLLGAWTVDDIDTALYLIDNDVRMITTNAITH